MMPTSTTLDAIRTWGPFACMAVVFAVVFVIWWSRDRSEPVVHHRIPAERYAEDLRAAKSGGLGGRARRRLKKALRGR